MKKSLSFICIILVFFVIYFLQTNFFSWFNIANIKPNMFIILILFIGLFTEKKVAAVFGLLMGMYLDILTAKQVGISAITYAGIGYVCGYLDKTFSKESKITIILIGIGGTIIYETIVYIYSAISNNIPLDLINFNKILIVEVIFNCLLTIIIYPLMKKFGFILERIFKSKTKTKYIFE